MPLRLAFGTVAAAGILGVAVANAAAPPVFRGHGIVLHPPSGWYVTNEPLNGITDPVQRFVLSSFRVPSGADAGGGWVPPATGVLVQLAEEVPPVANAGDWRARPHRFSLTRLGRMETLGGDRWGELLFREHARHFYLFIWVGKRARPAQVGRLLSALDRMSITAS
jgi:hypothetical protein